jgi:hypothetical protein
VEHHQQAFGDHFGGKVKFRLAAGIRAGLYEFNCNECGAYEKEQQGCEKPTEVPFLSDEDDDFYNCPFLFVAPNTFDFLEKYDIIKSGVVSPLPYGDTSNRFIEAVRYYEPLFNNYCNEVQKRRNQPPGLTGLGGKKDD